MPTRRLAEQELHPVRTHWPSMIAQAGLLLFYTSKQQLLLRNLLERSSYNSLIDHQPLHHRHAPVPKPCSPFAILLLPFTFHLRLYPHYPPAVHHVPTARPLFTSRVLTSVHKLHPQLSH
jgi:hypothetical protein